MLTPYGKSLVLSLLEPCFKGGTIEVSDGAQTSSATIERVGVTDAAIQVTASFGLEQANFEWKTRRVLDKDGEVVDEADEDGGRKAVGSVWAMSVDLTWGT